MAFSSETKRRVLIAAARHCCVCHRYKGVKVEVHHIVPQSKGGTDDFKNAIALCFDCHCDAGHYTDQHPRGTKFSPEELSAARDRWYELVSQNGIVSPDEEDILYCRYLVCRDVQAFREILAGDLTKLPFGNALLVENSVLTFQRTLLQNYSGVIRRTTRYGKSYKDIEAYLQVFPDAVRTDRSSSAFGFYETCRIPSLVEITEIGKSDAFTSLLVKAGVPPSEISCAVGHTIDEPSCGGPPDDLKIDDNTSSARWFEEEYHLRPLWGIFLAATNESKEKIHLKSLRGHVDQVLTLGYRQFIVAVGEEGQVQLPGALIPAGETILIPLGTVLAPLNYVPGQPGSRQTQWLEGGEGYY